MRLKALLTLVVAVFAFGDAKIDANITAVKLDGDSFFVGTDAGEILRYNLRERKIDESGFLIKLPNAKSYIGEDIKARIHALDALNGQFLIVSEGDSGTQNVSVCRNFKADANNGCVTIKSPFTNIKKVFFLDDKTAIFALLSSDIRLVDLSGLIDSKKELRVKKEYKFSITSLNDIALSADKQRLLAGTESGELQIFDIKSWRVLANYDKINKDTIDQVDYKNGVVVSCSKERKIGIVINGEQKDKLMPFLTYSCALSPSGGIAAYSMLNADNYNSATTLVQTRDFRQIKSFENGRFFAKFIVFVNESEFIVAGDKQILVRGVQ